MIKKETCILTYINYMRVPQCHILLFKAIHWHYRKYQSYSRKLVSAIQKRFCRLKWRIGLHFFAFILYVVITSEMLNAQHLRIFICENFVSNKLIDLKEFTNKFDSGLSWPPQRRDSWILLRNEILDAGISRFTGGFNGAVTYKECNEEGIIDCFMQPESRKVSLPTGTLVGGIIGLIVGHLKRTNPNKMPFRYHPEGFSFRKYPFL